MMPTHPTPAAPEPTGLASARRRRRRPEERLPPSASAVAAGTPAAGPHPRAGARRRSWGPASWGLSPTFRVLLFLGGILAVMAFLLYNEYAIGRFREQERDRAELYANMYGLAISEAVPAHLSSDIFDKIIGNESISFPLIVTDHRGRILMWKGPGLPPPVIDVSLASGADVAAVRAALRGMDAANEPIAASWNPRAVARVYRAGEDLVIADPDGYAAVWAGPGLPSPRDTTAAAHATADEALRRLQGAAREHAVFHVPTDSVHYLVRDGLDFVVARAGRAVAWGGPELPPFDEAAADAAAAQALYDRVAAGVKPVEFRVHNEQIIHFGDTELMSRISVAPFVTVGVLLLFVAIGWVGSRNIRRSEQHSIWVGMAKETAHQLGTPLSSLSGWLELMAGRTHELAASPAGGEAAESVDAITREMQKDMGRLTQIASRFSQIGSVPELRLGDVRDVIAETASYLRGRGPTFGRHEFVLQLDAVPPVPLNAELMGWALENLFKNAIDAMVQKEGTIRVVTALDAQRRCVVIEVTDDGRGIEPEHLARVFQPGYSTKKRGWGLGLAFVRRIVEEYHGGRIHVARSEPGAGTTFQIELPTADPEAAPR